MDEVDASVVKSLVVELEYLLNNNKVRCNLQGQVLLKEIFKLWRSVMNIFKKTYMVKLIIDLFLGCVACGYMAFYLRLESRILTYSALIPHYMLVAIISLLAAELIWRLPLRAWRCTGIPDLVALLKVMIFFGVAVSGLCFMRGASFRIPRSIPLINTFLAMLALGGCRILFRLYFEHCGYKRNIPAVEPKNILIVGAGEAGTMIAREMLRHPEAGLNPQGFLDDDPAKVGAKILGLPVFGPIDSLPDEVKNHSIDEILIAIPSGNGRLVRRIVDLSRKAGVSYRIIPGVYQVLSGAVSISQIRKVDIEDLLGREPVRLDIDAISKYLRGKRILVTGAGGSIGSEIVRQVARFGPEFMVLLGRGENSLFELEIEVKTSFPNLKYKLVIADVQNRSKLKQVFKEFRPQVVFHAAAHKHVPLMEDNPDQAIINNVGGTRNVAELALEWGVERFINISTDKAVNPTSVMGASKRIAEMVVRSIAAKAAPWQSFVSVRFGNVLGSRGSVIPIFKRQIAAGGPVTVTHPEMKRYFMTIPEAAQLVLEAAALPYNGKVYVLDMGEPVKIKNLAEDLIKLSGFTPYEDIDIIYTGLRPGEKLFEELLTAEEGTIPSPHEKIFIANQNGIDESFEEKLEYLLRVAQDGDKEEILSVIKMIVPTFRLKQPIEV